MAGKAKRAKAANDGSTNKNRGRGERTEMPRVVPLSTWMAYVDRVWRAVGSERYRVMEDDDGVECVHSWNQDKKCFESTSDMLPDGWAATDPTVDLTHWGVESQLIGPKAEIDKLQDIFSKIDDLQRDADDIIYGRWNG